MRAVLLVLAAVALGACSDGGAGTCPGEPVATFRLGGALLADQTACTVEPPGGFAAVAAAQASALTPFVATLAQDPTAAPTRAAALCTTERLASTWFGARQPDGTYVLEAPSGAAVLLACGPSCSASARERITGALTFVDGVPTSFGGTLVETFEYLGGDCGLCSRPPSGSDPGAPLHCAATYALTTVP